MGCCGGDREKNDVTESQKWDYVNLQDFRGSGLAYFSYAWLWMLALIAVAVYGADTFTAVNLLAYDKWSGQVQPKIPLQYSKWIFAACIFFSWALCIFEWIRAVRVIRRRSVAESYMDPLAVTLQSIRPQGWKRFLVFAELTTSKKGVDYIALFVYFSFKGAVRIILAEGPRQAVNAITLYSFMQKSLIPVGEHAAQGDHSSFAQFFINVEILAEESKEQAVVLFTMLFTLVIWVISALCLLISIILYICFLWHYIPQKDGRLSNYCRRKIDRRLEKIVGEKVKKALEDQEKKRLRQETKAAKKNNQLPPRPDAMRKPTLPQIAADSPSLPTEGVPSIPRVPTLPDVSRPYANNLQRNRSEPDPRNHHNLPPPARTYTAPPMAVHRQPTYPKRHDTIEERPGMPYRSDTETSGFSQATYSSEASLLEHANGMSYDDEPVYHHAQPEPMHDRQMPYSRSHTPYGLDRQPSHPPRMVPNRMMNGTPQQQMGRPSFDMDNGRRIMNATPQQQMGGPGFNMDNSRRMMNATPGHVRSNSNETVGGRVIPPRAPTVTPQQQMARQGYETAGGMGWQDHSIEPLPLHTNHYQQISDASTSSLQPSTNNNPFLEDNNTALPPLTRSRTPDPSTQSFEMQARPDTALSTSTAPPAPQTRLQFLQAPPPIPSTPSSYVAFSPSVYSTTQSGVWQPAPALPNRSATNPPEALRPINGASIDRNATATAPPIKPAAYMDLIDEYRGMAVEPPARSGTAAPDSGRSGRKLDDW